MDTLVLCLAMLRLLVLVLQLVRVLLGRPHGIFLG